MSRLGPGFWALFWPTALGLAVGGVWAADQLWTLRSLGARIPVWSYPFAILPLTAALWLAAHTAWVHSVGKRYPSPELSQRAWRWLLMLLPVLGIWTAACAWAAPRFDRMQRMLVVDRWREEHPPSFEEEGGPVLRLERTSSGAYRVLARYRFGGYGGGPRGSWPCRLLLKGARFVPAAGGSPWPLQEVNPAPEEERKPGRIQKDVWLESPVLPKGTDQVIFEIEWNVDRLVPGRPEDPCSGIVPAGSVRMGLDLSKASPIALKSGP